jgi:probable rRNA maturation factor
MVENCVVDVEEKKVLDQSFKELIENRIDKIIVNMDCAPCEVSVVICDDEFIHQLNRDYRDKDKPTDVLSFPGDFEDITDAPVKVLGDIIISVETAKRQAETRNHSLELEMQTLLIHGMLHLLGYTHEGDDDEAVMESKAKELLTD